MICIAGKNDIAVDVCKYILEKYSDEDLCVCLNSNDNGLDGWQKSLKRYSIKNNISIVKLEDIYSREDLIFLSLEYDKVIDIKKFKSNKLYNIHFSLLPKYRGVYTSAWPILNNEEFSGVTLHKIDYGIDTGDIIDQIAFKIDFEDTARDLYLKYIKYGTLLVLKNIFNILNDEIKARAQNKYLATYYNKKSIIYSNIEIDFKQTAINVYNQVRAYSFKEFQLPRYNGFNIIKCTITDEKTFVPAGTVLMEFDSKILIATLDYNVQITLDKNNEGE